MAFAMTAFLYRGQRVTFPVLWRSPDENKKVSGKSEDFFTRRKGLEPPTFWFVAKHSIQLS